MIARLKGTLVERGEERVVLDVHGVGYDLSVPLSTLRGLGTSGSEVTLLTRLIVRENAMELFGFAELQERQMFDLLLSVSGIGPRLALAVLSAAEVHLLRRAIASSDVDLLVSVPGIGKKTAQRLLVELKDKIGDLAGGPVSAGPPPGAGEAEAVDALVALGYARPNALVWVRKAAGGDGSHNTTEGLVRAALALSREKVAR